MILVTGAAGKTGRAIVRALAAKGLPVRALVRRAEQIAPIEALGAREVMAGDMRDEAMLSRAAHGAHAIHHICPNVHPDEVAIGRAIIAAARAAGVERFVFHSVLHPQTKAMPHHWRKLRVEEMLFESGLTHTILQPAPYMQNVLPEWRTIVEQGVYRVPYSIDAPFSPVNLEDVAEAAVATLSEPDHAGAIYELAGPEVLTPSQMAGAFSRVLNRPVRAERIPVEAWIERVRASGMGEYAVDTLAKMFRYYDRFGLWGNPRALSGLLGRAPTRFETFVRHNASEQQATEDFKK
jgi:uncharacterized protein YbjT (DUF2867 family)